MIGIGNHVSISLGYEGMLEKEKELGGNTFAFFTRNPRSYKEKKYSLSDVDALRDRLSKESFYPLVAHMPYTLNLCSMNEEIREVSLRVLKEDVLFMNRLKGNYLNFHPGSRQSEPLELAIQQIASALDVVLPLATDTMILLETMAGKGSEVGSSFEELRQIIDSVNDSSHLGVCLDTCHVFDAGYDIKDHLDDVLDEFDRVIGLNRLKAIHLNDTKNILGSHKDRHEKLGLGNLGYEAIKRIVQNPRLQNLPFILETPNEDDGYKKEIKFVRENMIG